MKSQDFPLSFELDADEYDEDLYLNQCTDENFYPPVVSGMATFSSDYSELTVQPFNSCIDTFTLVRTISN
jgi:hypothetical protein